MGDIFAPNHILLILLLVLIFFGGKKIPELMRGLGKGIREFKDAKDNIKREIDGQLNEDASANATKTNSSNTSSNQ
jgi:sec-independent protein translocase protein TatA